MPEGQKIPPQEIEVSQPSRLYLLVLTNAQINTPRPDLTIQHYIRFSITKNNLNKSQDCRRLSFFDLMVYFIHFPYKWFFKCNKRQNIYKMKLLLWLAEQKDHHKSHTRILKRLIKRALTSSKAYNVYLFPLVV